MTISTTVTLPFPVSTNALWADGKTRRHKSQRYADWSLEAGYALNRQKPKPVLGPVSLLLEVQDCVDSRRRDLSNMAKGAEDLLVSHGIIEGDDDRFVRELRMVWSREVKGVRITIAPSAPKS
jgi:Holliday junction resolvase RusA-like endonuclease